MLVSCNRWPDWIHSCRAMRKQESFASLCRSWWISVHPRRTHNETNQKDADQCLSQPRTYDKIESFKNGRLSFLSEDTVDSVRKLAGSFIEGLQSKLAIKIGSDHALWVWAARHASWASTSQRCHYVPLHMSSSMARLLKRLSAEYTSGPWTKEKLDGIYAYSWGKWKAKTMSWQTARKKG